MSLQPPSKRHNLQAFRRVDEEGYPTHGSTVIYIECIHDPISNGNVILWSDIMALSTNAQFVHSDGILVSFLRGNNLNILEPRRIKADIDTVLSIVCKQSSSMSTPPSAREQISRNGTLLAGHGLSINRFLQDKKALGNKLRTEMRRIAKSMNLTEVHTKEDGHCQVFHAALKRYLETRPEGHAQAVMRVGDLFYKGKIVQRNLILAIKWYREAALLGKHIAQQKIDRIQSDISHQSLSSRESLSLETKAIYQKEICSRGIEATSSNDHTIIATEKLTSSPTQVHLSTIPENIVELKMRANSGDIVASATLGDIYMEGRGTPIDIQEAIDWFLKAEERGSLEAQDKLRLICHSDNGMAPECTVAINRLRAQSKHGDSAAEYCIGKLRSFSLFGTSKQDTEIIQSPIDNTNIQSIIKQGRNLNATEQNVIHHITEEEGSQNITEKGGCHIAIKEEGHQGTAEEREHQKTTKQEEATDVSRTYGDSYGPQIITDARSNSMDAMQKEDEEPNKNQERLQNLAQVAGWYAIANNQDRTAAKNMFFNIPFKTFYDQRRDIPNLMVNIQKQFVSGEGYNK